MEDILGNIYGWFESLYGSEMGDYLWGIDCNNAYSNATLFNNIGLVALGLSALAAVVYYFIINSARLVSWWQWLIVLLINGAVNMVIGISWLSADLESGKIPACFVYNEDGSPKIDSGNCFGFGLANLIVSAMFFFVISVIVKRFSSNCRNTPFVSLFPKK